MADLGTGTNLTTRRTIVRGAAWSVPVVSMAATAPAFASSTCRDGAYRVRWGTEYSSDTKRATANRTSTSGTGALGSAALTLAVTSEFSGSMGGASSGGMNNLEATDFALPGGGGDPGLAILQRVTTSTTWWSNSLRYPLPEPRSNNYQRVTLTFNRPVWNLKFILTDTDSNAGQYQDRVFVSGSPTFTLTSHVSGGGSASSPWRPVNNDQNWQHESESQANVSVDYTGLPASNVYTITYWNDQAGNISGNGLQGVFLGTLTFSAETCG